MAIKNNISVIFVLLKVTHVLSLTHDEQHGGRMKNSEFIKWLQQQGVTMKPGKGSHLIATLNGRSIAVPNHKGKEIANGTARGVKKALGLK
ncbi:type II toxin-antitoxin system HicA family toxin [Paludibacterium denitrificans]|nr:type II toxin-antitoxin system HicA family toxin [Paludibacterium denitrificans]